MDQIIPKKFGSTHKLTVLWSKNEFSVFCFPTLYSYAPDLSSLYRKRLEVSENVKYIAIAVTSRASKFQSLKLGLARI